MVRQDFTLPFGYTHLHLNSIGKSPEPLRLKAFPLFLSGGDKRDRTADLLNAIQALSQLSYTPVFNYPQYLRHISKQNLDFNAIIRTKLTTLVFEHFVKFCRSKGWSTGYCGLPAELYPHGLEPLARQGFPQYAVVVVCGAFYWSLALPAELYPHINYYTTFPLENHHLTM